MLVLIPKQDKILSKTILLKITAVRKMNELKIQKLQYELNAMIDNDDDFNKIYETSVELDSLIVEYYNHMLNRKEREY